MMKKLLVLLGAILFLFGVAGKTNAALHDRGGGLIYDDVLDITWLQDANYAFTSGYHSTGLMDYGSAESWAAGLSYYDSVRDVTYDDWRLPYTPYSGDGYRNEGEMGHLYYDEGITSASPAPFFNIWPSKWYWVDSWFQYNIQASFTFGGQWAGAYSHSPAYEPKGAWAVRSGDVVPVPATLLLLGSGLLGLGIFRQKIRRRHG